MKYVIEGFALLSCLLALKLVMRAFRARSKARETICSVTDAERAFDKKGLLP